MNPTEKKLTQKIRRLENKLAEIEAEREVYQMMAHDIAPDALIAAIERKWPAIAALWEAA